MPGPVPRAYKHSPVDSALKTLSHFTEPEGEARRGAVTCPRSIGRSAALGISALGPGEAGRAGATPGSAESRGAERRAGRKARGCGGGGWLTRRPLRVQAASLGKGASSSPGGGV